MNEPIDTSQYTVIEDIFDESFRNKKQINLFKYAFFISCGVIAIILTSWYYNHKRKRFMNPKIDDDSNE